MNFNEGEKNAYSAIRSLIKNAKIKVTDSSLKQALWNHPDFPSFTAFSDVLNDFKVDNLGTRINIQQLSEIPLPALVHFDNDRGGLFGTITQIRDEIVDFEVDGEKITEDVSQFIRHWGGVTLLIQPSELSGESNFKIKRFWEVINAFRLPFIGIALLLMVVWLFQSKYSFDASFALLLFKITGTFISSLLLWQSLDSNNSFLLSICQLNEKTNCNSILQSKGAKLFGLISWAEIGLFYFGGGILNLIINKNPSQCLIYFNYLALPYVIYSVYYQAFVVRKWCILCLIIQLVFVLEFITSIYISPSITNIKSEILSFSIIPLLWWLIKPMFQKGHHYDMSQRELQKIIYSPDYLQSLSIMANELPPFFEGLKPIMIGNQNAQNTLLIVANPTCATCAKHIREISSMLDKDANIKVEILLASGIDEYIIADNVAMTILSLPHGEQVEKLLEWFKSPDQRSWNKRKKSPINNDGKFQIELAARWLYLVNIRTAPALILNNIKLPLVYNLDSVPKLCKLLHLNEDLIRSQ